jgi:hypothetical protein
MLHGSRNPPEPTTQLLIPYWCKDPKGGRKPINAKRETVRDLPTFRDAYRKRRCIVPVDGFFEWKAIKGQRPKQPYAIAMKDGAPFGLAAAVWENWQEPTSGEWIRTFAIITTAGGRTGSPTGRRDRNKRRSRYGVGRQGGNRIPMVFIVGEDPVRLGLVSSLGRPGGNLTGINFLIGELTAKRLGLLRELVPRATRIAVLVNPANATNARG